MAALSTVNSIAETEYEVARKYKQGASKGTKLL